ncbi:hypothetical protein LIER_20487 [Lithospermum erythrorhizon]|uniref:Uncharacterized protein n=1 Tax=Lithospermum erythrorhizon TaxID=34254 RepID=A0AAV3QPS0_LITER
MAENSNRVPLVEAINGGDMEDNIIRENERPKEPWKGEFARSIVYSGLDAIITSFSLISSISAGNLSSG